MEKLGYAIFQLGKLPKKPQTFKSKPIKAPTH